MLATHFKFHFENNTGFDLDLNGNSSAEILQVNYKKWKLTTGGALEFDSETALTYTAADIADGASAELTEDDNSTDLDWALHGEMNLLTDDSGAAGTVDLYVEFSTDGGSTYPSDAADFILSEDALLVAALQIAGDGTGYKRSTNFEI